jgi:predicted DNA repair protein MutK
VIDDAAVTPRYVVGLAAERELPIVRKIATGSLKNKMLFLLPGALALSVLAPWVITPLLMAGGAFLCLEGFHKVMDLVRPHQPQEDADLVAGMVRPQSAEEVENERVASAIRTDFILSAEIMAITLGSVSASPFWMQALVLAAVGVLMTVLVYGAVALIVKADDAGVALAQSERSAGVRALGRGIVAGMPPFLKALSVVGMVAMLWVGGGILIHGLHELGVHGPEAWVHGLAEGASAAVPALKGLVGWLVNAGVAAVIGLGVGALVEGLVKVLAPLVRRVKNTDSNASASP